MHKINAIIYWLMNVHNQLYGLQSLRTFNTPTNTPATITSVHCRILYNDSRQSKLARKAISINLMIALVSLHCPRTPSLYITPSKITSKHASVTLQPQSPTLFQIVISTCLKLGNTLFIKNRSLLASMIHVSTETR